MSERYPRLFSSFRLGPVTLRNRVVFAAHLTNYARGGLPTEQHVAYYQARAAGGAGLIITEEQCTHPTDWPYEKMIQGYRPEVVDGYRRITGAVHAHGATVLAQVNHNGGQGTGMYSRRPLWAPSAVPDPLFREVPKAVERHEIAEIVDGYATVARHCVAGGFDGVELQCSHSSLMRGFLARGTNRRTDEYGGDLEGRARLLLEVLGAMRAELGPDRILGVRLSGDERIDGGIVLDEATATARLIEASGHVDYLNTSIGMATASLHLIEASMAVPKGYALYIPSAIRDAVDLPVVGIGRFKDAEQAEQALAEGHCDLVGVVRGQIADPDFVAKARADEVSSVRNCLSCNQECVGRMGLNRWLGCLVNPRAGRESVVLPDPTRRVKDVWVIGGGPAGLQAAATAAERGHRVTLYERDRVLGGQVRAAARAPYRGEFAELTRNLESECRRRGVVIELGVDVTAEMVESGGAESVIVATGARPRRPQWAGVSERVVDVRDVLEDRCAPTGRVLVVDELGFHQATSVAEWLADRGAAVTVCTGAMTVGQDLGITLDMEGWQMRAHEKGIEQVTDVVPVGVGQCGGEGQLTVELLHHPTGGRETCVVDWVVGATHQDPVDELWMQLRGSDIEVHRIGDALTPRRAHAAVIEGHRAAVAL
ncbi:mycofactocin system FadH/OYE family oxidoreductase 2 [Rhodococcus sp. D2-41]|uniref:mycofactocin system FadH/OYE family oxidoreductase 2 n=1 Tax=Speluncibacter jeojiensis TaxID=2710754 RepID=UPI0024104217|nr:mycofactocin system FadH/OYE family oxidoreductase 2 [Rhodococcus sp. D2-41]MDG3011704.1 mycofactocin system FadH/OYE family oxidoreductase 2 [Rhodococcus sp. D2-41]